MIAVLPSMIHPKQPFSDGLGGQIYKKIAIVFENDKCIGCMLFVSVLIICLLIGHIIQNLTKHILNICCNEK